MQKMKERRTQPMKKLFALLLVLAMMMSLVACGAADAPAAEAENVPMQYIKAEEAKELLENDEYVFFDIRKAADSSANSIPSAESWDMDVAKEGDAEVGKATMTKATEGLDKEDHSGLLLRQALCTGCYQRQIINF